MFKLNSKCSKICSETFKILKLLQYPNYYFRGIVYAKPVGTVRPLQAEMSRKLEGGSGMIHRPNILSRGSNFPVEALAKQGVSVQQITVPKGNFFFFKN